MPSSQSTFSSCTVCAYRSMCTRVCTKRSQVCLTSCRIAWRKRVVCSRSAKRCSIPGARPLVAAPHRPFRFLRGRIAQVPWKRGANEPERNDGALTVPAVENHERGRHVAQKSAKWARTRRKLAGGISSSCVARVYHPRRNITSISTCYIMISKETSRVRSAGM